MIQHWDQSRGMERISMNEVRRLYVRFFVEFVRLKRPRSGPLTACLLYLGKAEIPIAFEEIKKQCKDSCTIVIIKFS